MAWGWMCTWWRKVDPRLSLGSCWHQCRHWQMLLSPPIPWWLVSVTHLSLRSPNRHQRQSIGWHSHCTNNDIIHSSQRQGYHLSKNCQVYYLLCKDFFNIFVFHNQTWQNAEWYNQYERMITSYYRSRIKLSAATQGAPSRPTSFFNTAAA